MSRHRIAIWKNPDWYCHGVLDGSLEVERVYENDQVVAFVPPKRNRHKNFDVHVLLTSRRHVETLLDLGSEDGPLLVSFMDAVQGVCRALDLEERGFYVRANVLPPYQGTGHIHMHVLSGKHKKKKHKQ